VLQDCPLFKETAFGRRFNRRAESDPTTVAQDLLRRW